jgi:hypothetical protein
VPGTSKLSVPSHSIEHRIHIVRGHRVMFDSDLAALYGVSTKRFNEAVKRNLSRFPKSFMFRLTSEEAAVMRSQLRPHQKETLAGIPTTPELLLTAPERNCQNRQAGLVPNPG